MIKRAYLLGGRPADDGLNDAGGQDQARIDTDQDQEAVKTAAPMVDDVRKEPGNKRSHS
jgi:hypothetical protein